MSSVKKIILTALAAVALFVVALFAAACGEPALTGISVTKQPSVTEYVVGDSFNADGMEVTASYDDDSTRVVTNYTVSPSVFTEAGEQTVTISYEGMTATVTVNVSEAEPERTLDRIEVTTEPTDKEYFVGESLNTAGMVVTAYYSDDTSEPVTGYEITPATFETAGDTVTVTVTYRGESDTFTVKVTAVTLAALEITGTPSKLTYDAGETFSAEGIAVKATYNNGTTNEAFDEATLEYSKTGSSDWNATAPELAAGDTTIYVRAVYGEVTSTAAEFTVTVNVPVTSVEITNGDSCTLYVGSEEKGNVTLSATVLPDNATDKTVTWSIKSGEDYITLDNGVVTAKAAGTAVVTATAGGKTDTITITVEDNDIESISVTNVGVSGSYIEGQTLDASSVTATVTATYKDGSSAALESGSYTIRISLTQDSGWAAGVTFAEDGNITVYVLVSVTDTSVTGSTQTTVNVAAKQLTALEITGAPSKLTYDAGETFSAEGIAVKATYNNGTTDEDFKDYILEYGRTGNSDWSTTAPTLNAGDAKVYVRATCDGVTSAAAEFTVTVTVPATDITLNITQAMLQPDESVALEASVQPSGSTDNVSMKLTEGDGYVSLENGGITANSVGKAVITVTAGSVSKTVTVWVYEATVEINLPDRIYVGEQFGFTVTTTLDAPEDMPQITVLGNVTLPDGVSVEYYENAGALAGKWVAFPGGDFGPAETGFPLTDATSSFRATLNAAQEYTFTVDIIGFGDRSNVYATDTVSVTPVVRGTVEIDQGDSKTLYVGNGTTQSAVQLTATVNGEPAEGAAWSIVSGSEFISLDGSTVTAKAAGEAVIRVTVDGETAEITITVVENAVEYIQIDPEPTDREYTAGEMLDTAGMVVRAYYTDGTNAVAEDYTVSQTEAFAETGVITVTVTYEGKTDTFTVTVYAAPIVMDANNVRANVTIGSEKISDASGGYSTYDLKAGSVLYFDFYSDAAGKADITLRIATGYLTGGSGWEDVTEMGDMPLAAAISLELNGTTAIDLSGLTLEGGNEEDRVAGGYVDLWHLWRTFTFENIDVQSGLNTIEMTFLRHEQYGDGQGDDDVPGFAGATWGAEFGANIDKITVTPRSTEITSLTGCEFIGLPMIGEINSDTVAAESVNLKVDGDNLLLTFEVNADVTMPESMTGYRTEDPATQIVLNEYIASLMTGSGLYFDLQDMTGWESSPRDVVFSYEDGKIMAAVDVSNATLINDTETRYLTHIGSSSGNFCPTGDSFHRKPIVFNNLVYSLHYYAGFGENSEYFGCVGFAVNTIPVSMEALSVTYGESTNTIVQLTYDGYTRNLVENEYSISDNNVTYSYGDNQSLTATVAAYTVTAENENYVDNIKMEIIDDNGTPKLRIGVFYTLTCSESSLDTETARAIAEQIVQDMVYTTLGLSSYTNVDLQHNPWAQNGSNDNDWDTPINIGEDGGLLKYTTFESDCYGFIYDVDLSALTRNHYTIHFGAWIQKTDGSWGTADYKPGVDFSQTVTVGNKSYTLRCVAIANEQEDASNYWGCVGLDIIDV